MFRAYEPDRDRLVAIKLFRLDLPPERVHQLVAELEQLIAAGLDHPVIATPLAAGIEGVTAYLAQDYVTAESLDIVIREGGPAPLADALGVATRLASALDYAADRRIVHGGLHPRDVLLSPDDFRLVGLGVTRALERVGVPAPVRRPYTAPERIGGGAWDRRADVFSLAAVIHELISGRRLSGTGEQAAAAITESAGGNLNALRDVFTRALAENMSDRFETATEFAAALTAAFESKPAKVSRMVRRPAAPAAAPRVEPKLPLDADEPAELPLNAEPLIASGDASRDRAIAADAVPDELGLAPRVAESAAPEPPALHERIDEPVLAAAAVDVAGAEHDESIGSSAANVEEAVEPVVPVFAEPTRVERAAPVRGSLLSAPPVEASSLSLVWPLALAGIVGVALGFGAGYAVAIRDRPVIGNSAGVADVERPTSEPAAARPASADVPKAMVPVAAPATPTTVAPKPAPAPLFAGRVQVRSTPAGARVFVDGHSGGETPTTVRDLARGPHQVRLVHDGYTTVERRIVITAGEPAVTLTVPMARTPPPAPAKPAATEVPLVIESRPPGASVFLDGRQVGVTPLTFPLVRVGSHSLRLVLEGYRPWSGPVEVSATEPNRVTASLER